MENFAEELRLWPDSWVGEGHWKFSGVTGRYLYGSRDMASRLSNDVSGLRKEAVKHNAYAIVTVVKACLFCVSVEASSRIYSIVKVGRKEEKTKEIR